MEITIGNIIIYIVIFIALYTTILWLLVFWENRNSISRPRLKGNYPKVCIIIPCFNEEKTISKTVRSLLNLRYPKYKLEILIINDGSTDNTYQKAKKLLKYKQVRLFNKKNGGKWTALNYGLTKTDTEFIGCLDADSFVAPNSLKLIMTYFIDKDIMAVTSSPKIHHPKNIIQRVQKIEYLFAIFLRKTFAFLDSIIITPGPFSIYRKKVFEKIGPFRHSYNTEDFEMALRLQDKNYRITNASNACVYTVSPTSLKALHKQRERWYQGFLRNSWNYRHIFMNKKYGDLGLFALPVTFLSVLAFMTMMFYVLFFLAQKIINKFISWQAIGFDFGQITFNLNWFFINTSISMFMGFFVLVMSVIMLSLGKKISNEKSGLKKDFLFYLFIYGPLYLIWWLNAIYMVIFKKKNNW